MRNYVSFVDAKINAIFQLLYKNATYKSKPKPFISFTELATRCLSANNTKFISKA